MKPFKVTCISNKRLSPYLLQGGWFKDDGKIIDSLTVGKTYTVIGYVNDSHMTSTADYKMVDDFGDISYHSQSRFELMKDTQNVIELEEKIKKVEQTIDDVKNFKNLEKGSRVLNGGNEYIVAYVGHYVMVNIKDGNWWSAVTRTLNDIRVNLSNRFPILGYFTLVGDPLISDLEKELKDLNDQLKEASKPKELNCSDAPDGWYEISGKTYGGEWTNEDIQFGDVIFIKSGIVFMEDHGRFTDSYWQNEYCLRGIDRCSWYGYLVKKLP